MNMLATRHKLQTASYQRERGRGETSRRCDAGVKAIVCF
eukprot:COSAG02_NODE_12939_length_1469_cov_9.259124_1_plen_38_part_10